MEIGRRREELGKLPEIGIVVDLFEVCLGQSCRVGEVMGSLWPAEKLTSVAMGDRFLRDEYPLLALALGFESQCVTPGWGRIGQRIRKFDLDANLGVFSGVQAT